MHLHDWINLTEQLPDYARVTFTGGEPLMFDKFDEIFNSLILQLLPISYLEGFDQFQKENDQKDNSA